MRRIRSHIDENLVFLDPEYPSDILTQQEYSRFTHINANLLIPNRNPRAAHLRARLPREQPLLPATPNAQNPGMLLRMRPGNRQRRAIVLLAALDRAPAQSLEGELAGHGHPAHAARVADEDLVLLDVDGFVPEAEPGAQPWAAFARF